MRIGIPGYAEGGGLRYGQAHRTCYADWIFGKRVTYMAETETDTVNLAPGELVTEIERTRAELSKTIDEIADRVTPSKVVQRTSARVREQISQIDPLVGGAVALASVSATCFLIWRR